MVTRAAARKILATYGKAWETQSVPLILSIFAKDGIYHERAFHKPFKGHKGIAKYWQEKVVDEQSNIRFKLLNLWVSGDTVVAEWDARFYTNIEKANKHLREIAIMQIKNGKVRSHREFWHSKTTPT